MGNCLAMLWLRLLVFAATFSASQQEVTCFAGSILICLGTPEDTLDLSNPPIFGTTNSVTQIRISDVQVGNFTNEVLRLSFPALRLLSLNGINISPEFFPVGVFKNVMIDDLSILNSNIEYNIHFANVINDLEVLTSLDLTGNPIQNFDKAAVVTFDRITTLTFSPENIVCDCDLSWFRNYLLNYEEDSFTEITQIKCPILGQEIPIRDSNFCSASDAMMLECRVCSRASSNAECNAMATETCSTTQLSATPLCQNVISYQGGQKQITKSCAGPSSCQSANNENTCYKDNPSRCVYCCRGALCNDFETAVLENYYPENYPFRPTTPVPTTTLPTTTDKPTTSVFTTTPVVTTSVPTTLSPSTMATTFSTTFPTTRKTTRITTTFVPTTETTTLPTTTIQTKISTTNPQTTTQETTRFSTTMQPTTLKATTMNPTTTMVTTTQPTTTAVTTLQPTTTVTTMESTTTKVTTMEPTTTKVTTMQPTTTTVTTMQPTTTSASTMQPTTTQKTTTLLSTMQPTTQEVTTMQPTTTTASTMQPMTTTVTTIQPTTTTIIQPTTQEVTTMKPTTTTASTMQPMTTTVTTMQPTTTMVTTMQPTTATVTTMQPTTTMVSTTQPATTMVTTNQATTPVITKQSKTTKNAPTTTQSLTTSSTTPRVTITTTENQEGNPTTPDISDLTTSSSNIVKTTTIKTLTVRTSATVYFCPQNNQTGKYGDLRWDTTTVNSVAIIECPFNYDYSTANATRKCVLKGQSAVWEDPDLSKCSTNSEALDKLAQKNVTTENVEETAEELVELTDDSDNLEESDIENVVTVIERVSKAVNNVQNESESILDDILETVNHLSQVEVEELAEAQRTSNTSSRIIQVVENTIMSIEIQESEYSSKSEALDVTIIKLDNETRGENIRFPKADSKSEDEDEENGDAEETSSQTSIQIPKSAVGDATRVQFILYKDTSLFQAITTAGEETTKRPKCVDAACVVERQALRSFVISASIGDQPVTNLDTPVVNIFTHLTDDDVEFANNSQCVFWDFAAAEGRGDWSTEGCSVNSSEAGVTICHCTHLTNFALLLDIYGNTNEIPETHQRIITYISLGGVAFSFFCLVLALVSYSCAARLLADKRVKVLLNLMVALMLMNMAFLFDSMVSYLAHESKNLCFGAAVVMHYTLLCVMTWMAVEAFTMYLALVRVFDTKQRHFMLKMFLLGWGLPMAIVGASVGIDRENYGFYNNLCYLNRIPFYISFLVPVAIVLIWNSTVYVLVSRQMCRLRKRQTEFSQTFSLSDQLRASFSLTFLLGLTWLFGFFSFGELNLVATYLFAATNALQGFIVFMFNCVFKKEIRRQWQALCCPSRMLKDGDYGTGTYSRSRSGTNGSNSVRPRAILSNGREYDPVNVSSGRSTRSRSWFWQPDRRRPSVAESTTTYMTRLSGAGSEIGSPTTTFDVRNSRSGRNSNTTTFVM